MSALPATYRKIVAANLAGGSFDAVARIETVVMPSSVGANEVMVKVLIAGIEASDILQANGGYGPLQTAPPAATHDGTVQCGDCGCEGIGRVVAVGEHVKSHGVGDYCIVAGFGTAFREYVPMESTFAIKIPAPLAEFIILPISGVTAYGPLMSLDRPLKKGDTLLVTAASGGTGHIAVQLGKIAGATVVATCSNDRKAALLKELGADRVINYKTEDVAEVLAREFPRGLDVVYECVGGELRNQALQALGLRGRMWIIGSVGEDYTKSKSDGALSVQLPVQLVFKEQQVVGFFLGLHLEKLGEWCARLIELFSTGQLRMVVDRESCDAFRGLEGVFAAQKLMREGSNAGKIFVRIADE